MEIGKDMLKAFSEGKIEKAIGSINLLGKEYTPQELIDFYNKNKTMIKTMLPGYMKSNPSFVQEVIAGFSAAKIDIPAELKKMLGI